LATKLDLNGDTATLERDIQGGTEVVEVKLPFVASAAKGMAEARIPNMRGIMAARTKPLNVAQPIEAANATQVVEYSMPPAKKGCKFIDPEHVEELVELLHTEAKVI
jgi:electron transfer flavoprotein beta subunit